MSQEGGRDLFELQREYIVHSYVYYHYHNSVIPDAIFDKMGREILRYKGSEEWGKSKWSQIFDDVEWDGFSGFALIRPHHLIYHSSFCTAACKRLEGLRYELGE